MSTIGDVKDLATLGLLAAGGYLVYRLVQGSSSPATPSSPYYDVPAGQVISFPHAVPGNFLPGFVDEAIWQWTHTRAEGGFIP